MSTKEMSPLIQQSCDEAPSSVDARCNILRFIEAANVVLQTFRVPFVTGALPVSTIEKSPFQLRCIEV